MKLHLRSKSWHATNKIIALDTSKVQHSGGTTNWCKRNFPSSLAILHPKLWRLVHSLSIPINRYGIGRKTHDKTSRAMFMTAFIQQNTDIFELRRYHHRVTCARIACGEDGRLCPMGYRVVRSIDRAWLLSRDSPESHPRSIYDRRVWSLEVDDKDWVLVEFPNPDVILGMHKMLLAERSAGCPCVVVIALSVQLAICSSIWLFWYCSSTTSTGFCESLDNTIMLRSYNVKPRERLAISK